MSPFDAGAEGLDPPRLAESMASGLRDIARGITDPLEAALIGSQVCEPWAGDPAPHDDGLEDAIGPEIVRRAEERGDDAALAVLRTLEIGATERTAQAAARGAARLTAAGHQDPGWYAATLGLQPTGAAILHEDEFADGLTVYLEFSGPEHGAHTIGVHVDRNFDGIATDLVIGPSLEGLADQVVDMSRDPDLGRLRLESVDPEEARGRAVVALARAIVTPNRPSSDNVRPLWGIAMQRLALFSGEIAPETLGRPAATTPDRERRRLVDAFFGSDGAPERDDTAETIVRAAIDYASDRCGGDPLRWSPKVVGLFRIEWVDEESAHGPDVPARAPEVLRAWVAFAAAERGVGPHGTAKALAAVDGPV